jgi:uncharacterized protein YfaS (alpha-2-macroglobulin family)
MRKLTAAAGLALISGLLLIPNPAWTKTGPLRVVRIIPSGPVNIARKVTVIFSRSMKPLGQLTVDPRRVPVRISPRLPGKFKWINVNTLEYRFDKPAPPSTRVKVTVPAGVKSLDGSRLPAAVVRHFTTATIRVIYTRPRNGSTGLSRWPVFYVTFNQEVRLGDLRRKTYFRIFSRTGRPTTLRAYVGFPRFIKSRGRIIRAIYQIRPAGTLPTDSQVQLIIDPPLRPAEGHVVSRKRQVVNFRTYGPFRLSHYRCRRTPSGACNPTSGLTLYFSTRITAKKFNGQVSVSPKVKHPGPSYLSSYARNYFTVRGPFKPRTTYRITVNPAARDIYDQTIVGRTTFTIRFGDKQPVLSLRGNFGVLEKQPPVLYPLRVRNLTTATLRYVFLTQDQIVPFLVKTRYHKIYGRTTRDLIRGGNATEHKVKALRFKMPPNKIMYVPLDLQKYITGRLTGGLIFFDLSSPQMARWQRGRLYHSIAAVQVTDIGLTVKWGRMGTLIWTTSLSAGTPLPGVSVEIRNRQNQVLWRGVTGQGGLIRAPGLAKLKLGIKGVYRRWKHGPAVYLLAVKGDDLAFLGSNWRRGLEPWEFNIPAAGIETPAPMMVHAFSQLPLYRPGETVRFKAIVRKLTATGPGPWPGPAVMVRIKDSRGKFVYTKKLTLGSFSTTHGGFKLATGAAQGTYSIQVARPGDKKWYSAGSFLVSHYRTPTFKVTVNIPLKRILPGEGLKVGFNARFLFGAPVARKKARFTLWQQPVHWRPEKLADYVTTDFARTEDHTRERRRTLTSSQVVTSAQGEGSLSYKVPDKPIKGPARITAEVAVRGDDGRYLSGRKGILLHPAEFYLGLRVGEPMVKAGQAAKVNLLAATYANQIKVGAKVKLTLIRRVWLVVRKRGVGGFYRYETKIKDTPVQTRTVTSGVKPLEIGLTPPKPGTYIVVAESADKAGRKVAASMRFYAFGAGVAGWQRYDHDRIDVIADKKVYAPGETAQLLVKNPLGKCWALVTVERDGVMRQSLQQLDSAAAMIKVKILPSDAPNAFVSVVLVRGRISNKKGRGGVDLGKPAFKVGYAKMKVQSGHHKLKVNVKTDKTEYRPAKKVSVDLQVTDNKGKPVKAEMAVLAVDEAVFLLVAASGYDPYEYFFRNRPLRVATTDNRIHLIGRRHFGKKGQILGSGGGFKMRIRKDFRPAAFWAPAVVTGPDGRAKVSFKLPDNLTSFRILAVACTRKDSFGTGRTNIRVSKPILLTSALPNFLSIGDEFVASAVVINRTGRKGPITVFIKAQGLKLLEKPTKTVVLDQGQSREVGFKAKTLDGNKVTVTFGAKMAADTDAAQWSLPVQTPEEATVEANYAVITGPSGRLAIKVPRGVFDNRGGLELIVAPSLVGQLSQPFTELYDYPYDCLEQRTSRAVAYALFIKWGARLGVTHLDQAKVKQKLTDYFSQLPKFQRYDGGFVFWPGAYRSSPFLSAYVMDQLTRFKKAGLAVDLALHHKGLVYLRRLLTRDNMFPSWYGKTSRANTRGYALAVLAQAGQPIDNLIEPVFEKRQLMTPFGLAHLALALKLAGGRAPALKQTLDRLYSFAKFTTGGMSFTTVHEMALKQIMYSSVRDNAAALVALVKIGPEAKNTHKLVRWLLMAARARRWRGTQSQSFGLLAITDYLAKMEKGKPNFTLKAFLNDNLLVTAAFNSYSAQAAVKQVAMKLLRPGRRVTLKWARTGTGPAYTTVRLTYFRKKPLDKAIRAGFSVDRRYTVVRAAGTGSDNEPPVKPVHQTAFTRGQVVQVTVTMVLTAPRYFVVLEDPLPAGLEPINRRFKTSTQAYQAKVSGSYFNSRWMNHVEIRKRRVLAFANYLRAGTYTFTYLARAAVPGRFRARATRAFEMYAPEVWGRARPLVVRIK